MYFGIGMDLVETHNLVDLTDNAVSNEPCAYEPLQSVGKLARKAYKKLAKTNKMRERRKEER